MSILLHLMSTDAAVIIRLLCLPAKAGHADLCCLGCSDTHAPYLHPATPAVFLRAIVPSRERCDEPHVGSCCGLSILCGNTGGLQPQHVHIWSTSSRRRSPATRAAAGSLQLWHTHGPIGLLAGMRLSPLCLICSCKLSMPTLNAMLPD